MSTTTTTTGQAVAAPATPRLLDVATVARYCGVAESTVYRWARTRKMPPPCRIGPRFLRWEENEITDWINRDGWIQGD